MALENDLYGSTTEPSSQAYSTDGPADHSCGVGAAVYAELSTNGTAFLSNPYETPKSLHT